jgi:hypothetical protein
VIWLQSCLHVAGSINGLAMSSSVKLSSVNFQLRGGGGG